ncbi:chain length determinant protein EpsF [Methylibium sp.]|uniref:chain length determinant protein EpsF n=1 Tax=Methylibium sp. TaxID=2067992 RepID=UPI003D14CAA4
MTLSQFFVILRARWRLGLGIWLLTVGLVVGISLLMTAQYTATSAVVVDTKSGDALAGITLSNGGSIPGYMATQVDVALSERVFLRAFRAMKLGESAPLRERWQAETEGRGSFESWAAETMGRRYEVKPTRDSNALTLSFTAPDAGFAAAMANALMQAYIDTTLELRVEPAKQYNTFFDDRSKQLRDALEQAQAKLSDYQRKNGLLATDERLDIENARLAELSSQVVVLQGMAAETGGRQSQASADADRMQEVLSNPVVSQLSTDLSRQQARLEELNSRLGDQHPQVQEVKSSIAELRLRLEAATRRASGSVAVSNTVTQGRLTQATEALAEQRARVLRLKAQRDESSVLQRDAENAQRAYDAALARLTQTDMESQNRQTNVSILKHASQPPFPSSPKIVLNTAVALVLGALLAVGGALLREMTDRRLRTEEDVAFGLNQHLLAVIPHAALSSRRDSSRLRQIKTRVLSGLPGPLAR